MRLVALTKSISAWTQYFDVNMPLLRINLERLLPASKSVFFANAAILNVQLSVFLLKINKSHGINHRINIHETSPSNILFSKLPVDIRQLIRVVHFSKIPSAPRKWHHASLTGSLQTR